MLPSKNKAYQLLGQSTVYALTAYTNENLKMHRTREGVWKKIYTKLNLLYKMGKSHS